MYYGYDKLIGYYKVNLWIDNIVHSNLYSLDVIVKYNKIYITQNAHIFATFNIVYNIKFLIEIINIQEL